MRTPGLGPDRLRRGFAHGDQCLGRERQGFDRVELQASTCVPGATTPASLASHRACPRGQCRRRVRGSTAGEVEPGCGQNDGKRLGRRQRSGDQQQAADPEATNGKWRDSPIAGEPVPGEARSRPRRHRAPRGRERPLGLESSHQVVGGHGEAAATTPMRHAAPTFLLSVPRGKRNARAVVAMAVAIRAIQAVTPTTPWSRT